MQPGMKLESFACTCTSYFYVIMNTVVCSATVVSLDVHKMGVAHWQYQGKEGGSIKNR